MPEHKLAIRKRDPLSLISVDEAQEGHIQSGHGLHCGTQDIQESLWKLRTRQQTY